MMLLELELSDKLGDHFRSSHLTVEPDTVSLITLIINELLGKK